MKLLISVIIPVYNVETYLKETLDCLVNQTNKDFELILVNDGSTDGTQEIIESFIKEYSNLFEIKAIQQNNAGVSHARNVGMNQASGEYIYFFDSDDLLVPEAIEVMSQQLSNKVDLLKFNANQFIDGTMRDKNLKYKLVKPMVSKFYPRNKVLRKDTFLKLSSFTFQSPVWLYVYKKSLLENNGIRFEEGIIYEDELFNAIVFTYVESFLHIKNRLFTKRIRSKSITTGSSISERLNYKGVILEKIILLYQSNPNSAEKKFLASRVKKVKAALLDDLKDITRLSNI